MSGHFRSWRLNLTTPWLLEFFHYYFCVNPCLGSTSSFWGREVFLASQEEMQIAIEEQHGANPLYTYATGRFFRIFRIVAVGAWEGSRDPGGEWVTLRERKEQTRVVRIVRVVRVALERMEIVSGD